MILPKLLFSVGFLVYYFYVPSVSSDNFVNHSNPFGSDNISHAEVASSLSLFPSQAVRDKGTVDKIAEDYAESSTLSRRFEYIQLRIPWPSGIIVERVVDSLGNYVRVGRMQHNAVQLRPQWSMTVVVEKVLTSQDCAEIIQRTEGYVSKHGWPRGRHVDFHIRPTNDLPMDRIFPDEVALNRLLKKIKSKIFISMAKTLNLERRKFFLTDLFLTQYNYTEHERTYLGPHKDKSQWSFIVLLNDDFEG